MHMLHRINAQSIHADLLQIEAVDRHELIHERAEVRALRVCINVAEREEIARHLLAIALAQ